MNSIEILTKIYKPYKVSVKGKSKIFNCTCGNYVIKDKCNKDIKELYKYLNSRSFQYFPNLVENNRSDVNVFEYVEDVSIDSEQKLYDMIKLVSLLHNKTSFYKEITKDKIKDIYESLLGRVVFLEENLNKLIYETEDELFISPSMNLLLNNSTKIFESITFLKNEIEEWYKLCESDNKTRVVLVHNNLDLDHYIKNENDYLISWDNYIIDTPVIDIVKLYKKIYLLMDFTEPLKIYLNEFELLDKEKKLLYIMLVMPDELILGNDEVKNVYTVRKYLDYVFKTENLINNIY